jgi:hypothetical protein
METENKQADKRIQSSEMAERMAYAEYPIRELAKHAIELGQTEINGLLLAEADEAALKAGRIYISELKTVVDQYDNTDIDKVEDGESFHIQINDFGNELSKFSDRYSKHAIGALPGVLFRGASADDMDGYALKITPEFIKGAINVRDMGPKLLELLQDYYDMKTGKNSKESSDTE